MAEISTISWQKQDVSQVDQVQQTRHLARGREQNLTEQGKQSPWQVQKPQDTEEFSQIAKLSKEEMNSIRENINAALEPINVRLNFNEDQDSGRMVVKVINSETEEVIRQIPPEAMLKMAQRMEELTGILVDIWR